MQTIDQSNQTAAASQNRAQFTAGPWSSYLFKDGVTLEITEPEGTAVGYLEQPKFRDKRERKANAALITAAPELLATLKQIGAILNQPWKDCNGPKTLEIAKADCAIARSIIARVVAKAEGSALK